MESRTGVVPGPKSVGCLCVLSSGAAHIAGTGVQSRTVSRPGKFTPTFGRFKGERNLEPSSRLHVSHLCLYAAHSLTQLLQPPATKKTEKQ